jgi:EAL domain-containing protein (putative c-di-GMP-specific phosphodiesterase class I)
MVKNGHAADETMTMHAMTAMGVRRAMARGDLAVHCQPIVNCATGELEAAEALIRWQHPRRGMLAPLEWLPAVRSQRLTTALNLHILELAIAHRSDWRHVGIDLPLSVNVTPACLSDERFLTGVERLIEARSPAGEVHFEVTEQATVGGGLTLDSSVERLRRDGFEFLLDDFGAEYSSLSRLATLPFTSLKIDGSLVAGLTETREHRSVVHAAIHLAHTLGLRAVAERVETMSTWKLLHALGCDQLQGYLISKPMPAADFPAFVERYVPQPPDALHRRTMDRRGGDRRTGADRRALPTA